MSVLDKLLLRPIPNVEELYKNTRVAKELPEILKILALWGNNTTNLWRWHIILGTMATIFSILAAIGFSSMGIVIPASDVTNPSNFTKMYDSAANEIKELHTQKIVNQIFAFLAAVSISLLTAFNLGSKSNNTRNAWRELNTAVMRFNQNILQQPEVINAYERGETMIGGITFTKDGIINGGQQQREQGQQQQQKRQKQQQREQGQDGTIVCDPDEVYDSNLKKCVPKST